MVFDNFLSALKLGVIIPNVFFFLSFLWLFRWPTLFMFFLLLYVRLTFLVTTEREFVPLKIKMNSSYRAAADLSRRIGYYISIF